ncbi:MAG TPA: hypothetical protein VLG76_03540, partial [Rhabdochlamydiaceae bacterium]|nr:hypothetical protein [Rhabdochlamydiaceae bacterium]
METVSRVERPTQTHSPVHTEASVNCRKTAPTVLEIKGSEAPFTRLFNSIVGLYHRLIAFLKEKWDSLFSKKSEPVLQQKTDPHLAALEKAFEQAARAQSRSSRGESAELYYNGARSSDPLTEKNLLRTNGGVLPMRKPPATAASL